LRPRAAAPQGEGLDLKEMTGVEPARLRKRLDLERRLGVDALFVRAGPARKLKDLNEKQVKGCRACRLHERATQAVFGVGNPQADLMFIGEAPGADEDRQGEPFVGRAGKLLDKMIFAMGLRREDVYITNIVKHRPPQNREPRADEVETCRPYLEQQIEIIKPRIICTLGRPASNAMLGTSAAMSDLRGRWTHCGEIAVMPTYHPAYLLRSPGQKRRAWADLKKIVIALEEGPPSRQGFL